VYAQLLELDSLQSETYQAPISGGVHGTSGPLKVSFARPGDVDLVDEFIRIGSEYDPVRGVTGDLDAPGMVNKCGVGHS